MFSGDAVSGMQQGRGQSSVSIHILGWIESLDGLYTEGEDDGLRIGRTRTGCLGVMERLPGRRVHCMGGMSGVFLSFLIRSIEDPNCVRSCVVLPSWLVEPGSMS